jgi:hypothetical protein
MKKTFVLSLWLLAIIIVSAQPVITSFTPVSGTVGSSVTISGTNFSTTAVDNTVYFGAVKANVIAATVNSLTVTVPAGADFKPITVTTGGLTAASNRAFIVTFSNGGTINQNSYSSKIDFSTDLRPNGIVAVDLDGDGKPDLATPNNYSTAGQPASVSVLRNTSNVSAVSFAPFQNLNTGAVTYSLTYGDIDGDGKQDLIAHSIAELKISVFRNISTAGNISFAPKVDYTTVGGVHSISITDIDGDGKQDIIAANNLAGIISVYRNTGSPGTVSFAAKVDFTTIVGAQSVTSGDFDNDGKKDLAVTSDVFNVFSVFRNTSTVGNVSFSARTDISTGSGNLCSGITTGDLDDDGKGDLVVVINNNNTSSAQLYRNTSTAGNITFNLAATIAGGSSATSYHAALGDVNGDGKPDIALSVDGVVSGQNKVYQNNSTTGVISFGVPNSFPSFSPYAEAICDLDGDARPELISTYFIGTNLSVFKNRCGFPNISFINPTSAGTGATVTINGSNFTGATAVTFGGVPASSFTVVNASTITAVVGSGVSGDVVVTTPIGSGSISGFIFTGPAVITSFNPQIASPGGVVTITGNNFTNATAVSFGGIAATGFTVISPTSITAIVGVGASGNVSVTTSFGTGSLAGFTFIPVPAITSFTPQSGGQGSVITINGTNLQNVTAVSFGGIAATSFTVVNSTTITATVGSGGSGNVTVTVPGGVTASQPGFTFWGPPTIISFTPTSGAIGETVTITGTNLGPATTVSFGGVPAISITSVSATTISAIVSTGAAGDVSVTTPYGSTAKPGFTFIQLPVINSLSPSSGAAGSSVIINGSNFSTVTANNIVYFGTVRAQVISASANSLTVTVPVGSSFLPVTVTVNNLTAFSAHPFNITFPGGGSAFGPESFSGKITFVGGADPYTIGAQDLDMDGKADVIITDLPFKLFSVLRNTSASGVISFAQETEHPTSWVPYTIAVADFDGDGKRDIAVTNGSGDRKISLFKNTSTAGSVSFAARIDLPTGFNPWGIVANDFDSDGKPDLAIWKDDNTLSVLRNVTINGSISFTNVLSIPVGLFVLTELRAFDIDGDKKTDLIIPSGNNKVAIYRNTSSPSNITFAPKVEVTLAFNPYVITAGDLDGDGKNDLIANANGGTAIAVVKNISTPGSIIFGTPDNITIGSGPLSTSIGDLDGDGKPDLMVCHGGGGNGMLAVLKNTSTSGNISFSAKVDYPASVPNFSTGPTVIADFTGDGKPDMGMAYQSTSFFSVLTNQVGGPGINAVSPSTGGPGTVVTITGSGFTGATQVSFGGISATSFTVVNATTLTATVANGSTGNVVVITPTGTAVFPGFNFSIPAPSIISFTPLAATTGATVTITGTNFSGVTAVSFGGVAATSFTVVNATTITAVVAAGASGSISVTGPGGTTTLAGFTFNSVTGIFGPVYNNTIELLIAPNPVNDIAIIKHPSSNKNAKLRFVDMTGRDAFTVIPQRNTKQSQVDLRKLPAGVYYLMWSDGSKILSRTIMKE